VKYPKPFRKQMKTLYEAWSGKAIDSDPQNSLFRVVWQVLSLLTNDRREMLTPRLD
jgi:hypothetical protein